MEDKWILVTALFFCVYFASALAVDANETTNLNIFVGIITVAGLVTSAAVALVVLFT